MVTHDSRIFRVCFAVLAGIICSTVQGVEMNAAPPATTRLLVAISQDKHIRARVTLSNHSEQPVTYPRRDRDGYRTVRLNVVDKEGHRPPRTAFGERFVSVWASVYNGNEYVLLAPEGSLEWTLRIDKCFVLKPGTYTLIASVEINGHRRDPIPYDLASEPVTFTIR